MQLYSTNNHRHIVSLREAVLHSLPPDNGLYMPVQLPRLPEAFFQKLPQLSFNDIAFAVSRNLIGEEIPEQDLRELIDSAFDFTAPLVPLSDRLHILELFHGPSLAFKDFGARFMSRLMSYFNRNETQPLRILVATSGDTGGAVAAGFHGAPGIEVVILYPSGKVSPLQEKQLTTWGDNIRAIEVEGVFDDCQRLVKQAFLDPELNRRQRLSSANSINIARLIPQSFYYFEAWKQLPQPAEPVFVVPSGNFGNLTAGLLARRMGLPVRHFIAATNANRVVPDYLQTGEYHPRPSTPTLSNAMDVGAPSNFSRILDLHGSTWNMVCENISGYAYSDPETQEAVQEVFRQYKYIIDPHGAVGYLAWKSWQKEHPKDTGIVLETAHYSKFLEVVEPLLPKAPLEVHPRLAAHSRLEKKADKLPAEFDEFKDWLMK